MNSSSHFALLLSVKKKKRHLYRWVTEIFILSQRLMKSCTNLEKLKNFGRCQKRLYLLTAEPLITQYLEQLAFWDVWPFPYVCSICQPRKIFDGNMAALYSRSCFNDDFIVVPSTQNLMLFGGYSETICSIFVRNAWVIFLGLNKRG